MTGGATPRVSFVISCHSYGRYLKTAIDSLLAQGVAGTEIIVVDDASKDETAAVLREYRSDPRIIVVRHEAPHGHLRSNNEGLRRATGEFVGVFDADDFLLTADAVRRELEIFDRNPRVGFVYASYLLVDEAGVPFRAFQPWQADYVRSGLEEFRHLVRSLYVPHSSTLVRRACHDRADIYDLTLPYSADWDLWLRLCVRFDVGYIREPLLAYRQHRSQMSQRLISPHDATDNLVRTLDKAFASLPSAIVQGTARDRQEAYTRALLHQTWMDRSLGRVRRSWAGLVDAGRRSPRLLMTTRFYWAAARLALLTLLGHERYTRLVSIGHRMAGGKAAVV